MISLWNLDVLASMVHLLMDVFSVRIQTTGISDKIVRRMALATDTSMFVSVKWSFGLNPVDSPSSYFFVIVGSIVNQVLEKED